MALTAAAERVCLAALELLADRGYDGSSLSDIAAIAGIRKASLYSHFASKDELVFAALEMSLAAERTFIADCFADDNGELPGGVYLERAKDRYQSAATFRFLLRTAYAPPLAIREAVIDSYREFLAEIELIFLTALHKDLAESEREFLVLSYLGIVDSVQVELLYGETEHADLRRGALWKMLTLAAAQARSSTLG